MIHTDDAAADDHRPAGIGRSGHSTWIGAFALLLIPASGSARAGDPPTYAADVAPILRESCQRCHRPGQVGPFPLQTYAQARKHAADIALVAEDRVMPPWKPAPGIGPKLKHDRSLTDEQIDTLRAWFDAGAPEGDAGIEGEQATPDSPAEGWSLGTPDLVLEMTDDFHVPADGADIYRCFVIPTNLPHGVYVSAIEYQSGNRRAVHHMMAFVDTSGAGRARDEAEPGPGYTSYSGAGVAVYGDLGGWAAGNTASHLPDGIARALPAQADVILQVHYHPTGKPEVDRSRIGLHFSRAPVRQTLHWNSASNDRFRIPAGSANFEVKASWYVPVDVEAIAVTPHMHELGRDFHMSVAYPDGKDLDLISIPDWDPSWQDTYYFETPIPLPRGSIVRLVAHFDNSDHPRNPNHPPKPVRWGHEASDEMCNGYLGVVKAGQDLTRPGERDDLHQIFDHQFRTNQQRDHMTRRRR
jgi:hypothetical protein